jgi:hypothetical protein
MVMLKHMRFQGIACLYVFALLAQAATPTRCSDGVRQYYSCELSFDLQSDEFNSPHAAMEDDLLHVEFRSPGHTTYLVRHFWVGGKTVRIRFTPIEAVAWTYKITSSSKRLDGQETSFLVAETAAGGMVNVANLRHWRSTDKKPHLWLGADVPWFDLDQAAFETWLDARKKNGFTHVRGVVLNARGAAKPFGADGLPNPSYFEALDAKILAAEERGFTADLILADQSFLQTGMLDAREKLEPLIRYLVARYGGLNVTWQGIERFEDVAGARGLARDIGSILKKYDSFRHPRSSDARVTSSPLIGDGWMNFIVEASPQPELAAVEHQFTDRPSIHLISTAEPKAFRQEIWNATTNGQYLNVPFAALQNANNVKAIETWVRLISDTRHWEFEPFFDVDGARAVAVDARADPYADVDFVECLTYAQKPGIVEVTLPKHKYNPVWINPGTGDSEALKDTRTEVFSRETPDNERDWILYLPREGKKESMGRSYYFESHNPPVQDPETDPAKIPLAIVDPPGDQISVRAPAPFKVKITKANRATRYLQYVWWGEVVAGGEGSRVIGIGSSGTLTLPKALAQAGVILNLRMQAINANGKAYELNRVYTLAP